MRNAARVRGGQAGKAAVVAAPMTALRARVAAAERRVEEGQAREAGLLRRIARLEQDVADRDEALIDALRRMHEAQGRR